MTKIKKQLLLVTFILAAIVPQTYAVRPFITDDGVVAGRRVMQWEGWAIFNKHGGEQWNLLSYGVTNWFEVAIGGVYGYDRSEFGRTKFSFSAPLIETKYLLCGYEARKRPGIAIALGTALPAGKGAFVPEGYGVYTFLAATYVFDEAEKFIIHGNVGVNYLNVEKKNLFIPYGGLGAQFKLYKGLHLVGETIYGDPYAPGSGLAYQVGFRYFISDLCQVDLEIGQGLTGKERMPFWIGFGARYVIDFNKKKNEKTSHHNLKAQRQRTMAHYGIL